MNNPFNVNQAYRAQEADAQPENLSPIRHNVDEQQTFVNNQAYRAQEADAQPENVPLHRHDNGEQQTFVTNDAIELICKNIQQLTLCMQHLPHQILQLQNQQRNQFARQPTLPIPQFKASNGTY